MREIQTATEAEHRRMTAPLSMSWRAEEWALETEQLLSLSDLWEALVVPATDGSRAKPTGRAVRAAQRMLRDNMSEELLLATRELQCPGEIWAGARAHCQRKAETALAQLDVLCIRSGESLMDYVSRGELLFQQAFTYGLLSEVAAVGQVLRGVTGL